MDDGEVELSDHVLLPATVGSSNFQGSASIDSFLDELLKNSRTCTHTHTCNPPGPDTTHTHTCYHTHTQVIVSEEDDLPNNIEHPISKARRPSGNREAVRKYREKKKAQTAYLEEEVKKLRLLNQQLVRKLQGQSVLEAEVLRLRGLLLDLRGKIDNELGVFPFQKQCNSNTTFKERDCGIHSISEATGLRCDTDFSCFNPHVEPPLPACIGGNGTGKMMASLDGNCQTAIVDCPASTNVVTSAEGHVVVAAENMVPSAS